jgi:ABC-type Fe3+ transport system permease subunit
MAEIGISPMTLLRSLIVGMLAVAAARLVVTLLADRRRPVRQAAWILLLVPYFTPVLLTGYAYASFSLSLIHHPALNTAFYSALLWWKFTPIAAVILYFTPAPISAEAVHCHRLAFGDPGSARASRASDRAPRPDHARHRAWTSRGGAHCAVDGGVNRRTRGACATLSVVASRWLFLIRAGCAGGPVAAFAVVFLFAFAEFEMASLMVVKSWTVALFDAHAGGLALGESLRRMAGPLLCQAVAITAAFVVLGRREVMPVRRLEGGSASRWFARCHLVTAFIFVLAIPAAMVLWGTIRAFGLLVENFVLSREILASLLFAAGASTLASLAAIWFGRARHSVRAGWNDSGNGAHGVTRPTRLRNFFAVPPSAIFRKAILVAAVFAGLLGPLVLSLTVLAAVQLPGLIWLRDTPAPLVFTLGLVLFPVALVLKRVLELIRRQNALHLVALMDKSRAARELAWRLGTSGKFWALALLFVWAYWDLTASAILAPIGMTPVTVRLYNLMHYGQIAALSAMTCAAFIAPILIFLLALGTRRWWAPR